MKDIALIESFLNDELSARERTEVKYRLETDKSFIAVYEDLSLIRKAGHLHGLNQLKEHLKNVDADMEDFRAKDLKEKIEQKPPAQRTFWLINRNWVSIAASLLILVSALTWIWNPWADQEHMEFARNFQAPPNYLSTKSKIEEFTKNQILNEYDQGRFKIVIELCKKVETDLKDVEFYCAIGLIKTGRLTEAKIALEEYSPIEEVFIYEKNKAIKQLENIIQLPKSKDNK